MANLNLYLALIHCCYLQPFQLPSSLPLEEPPDKYLEICSKEYHNWQELLAFEKYVL